MAPKTSKTPRRVLSEQRNVTRKNGQFSLMDPCEMCGKRATLYPAFGGEDEGDQPESNKLICTPCQEKADKRLGIVR